MGWLCLIPLALTLIVIAGCGSDPGNEPTADKSVYQAPKDSMTKAYQGGPPGAAKPAGKPATKP